MRQTNHNNIISLLDFLETANNYYLVMEFCNNGDLETHVRKYQGLCEEEALYMLMQIMNAFRYLHKKQIMHRDVKLANIFLKDDIIKVGDFGFAKKGH